MTPARMTLADGVWRIWREAPGFHQRFTAVLSPDGRTFDGRWEISTDGVTWDVDSELSYPASDPTCPTWPVACPRAGR